MPLPGSAVFHPFQPFFVPQFGYAWYRLDYTFQRFFHKSLCLQFFLYHLFSPSPFHRGAWSSPCLPLSPLGKGYPRCDRTFLFRPPLLLLYPITPGSVPLPWGLGCFYSVLHAKIFHQMTPFHPLSPSPPCFSLPSLPPSCQGSI